MTCSAAGAAGALGLWLPFATDARSATWHARTANSRVPRRALAELRRALHGTLLLPGDPGYDAASAPANFRYDSIRPLAVASCRNEADVITCVDWSRAHHVPPVARGGGHSYAGYSTTEGLLVDIGQLNHVAVDHRTGHAVMAGAARNQNVLDATVDRKLRVARRNVSGGRHRRPHARRRHRLQHALGRADLRPPGVHPDGHRRRAGSCTPTANTIPTCSGPAGVEPAATSGSTPSSRSSCRRSPRARWRSTASTGEEPTPRRRSCARSTDCSSAIPGASTPSRWPRPRPSLPDGPREAIDVFSRGQFLGTQAELERYVQPLIDAAGPPAKRTLTTLKYWDMQRMFASAEGTRHSFGDVSRYSRAPLPDQTYAKIADLLAGAPAGPRESNGSMWSLGWIGGPVVRRVRPARDRLRASRHADAAARDAGVGQRRARSRCRTS